jgi:AraC-like DNA-binding protein
MRRTGSVHYIYASVIAPLPGVLADHGGNVDRPFREAGVPIELAAAPERVLPMRGYLSLLEAAARETGDELFGVSLAERMDIDDLGPFGRLLTSAPTLRRAIETCNVLVQNYSPALRSWLDIEGETARWHYQVTGTRDCREGRRLDCEQTLFLFRALARLATGSTWQPSEFLLDQATPQQLRVFQRRLGAPARSVGTDYALVFPRDLLDLPMTYAKQLGRMERQTLLTQFISTAPEGSFAASVKEIVRGQLCGGYPEMSGVARSTGLSVRTFQRRLAEDGMAYSDLVADVRRDLARQMLADPSRSQLDITLSLGYSDAANFSRAFKQWTGMAPSEFRRSMLASPAAV